MREDELLEEAFEPYVAPAAPSFFEAFWREAEQRQRRAARRWRGAALALAVIASAAIGAAGVLAASHGTVAGAVDQTWRCSPASAATGAVLGIHGSPKTTRVDPFFLLSAVQPSNNGGGDFGIAALRFDGSSSTVTWGTQRCKQVHAQPVLGARGLALNNVYTSTFIGSFSGQCITPPQVLVRAHVTFAHQRVASAKVIVVTATREKPLAYFVWTPRRIGVWLARSCDVRDYPY